MRVEYPGMLVSRADCLSRHAPARSLCSPPDHAGKPVAVCFCLCPLLTDFARPQENLQPSQAAQLLNDRVKRIAKVHLEIADWLQVRPRGPESSFRPHR